MGILEEGHPMQRLIAFAATASLIASAANAAPKPASFAGHELAGQAKVSLAQARLIALKARPGRIVDQELEKEDGGSGLRYSFDVASHGKIIEVGIDAASGKVLENSAESASKEAREAVQEKGPSKR
jgi:uncharacterized membrane protein YkoI